MHDYNTILGVIELRLSVLGVRPQCGQPSVNLGAY